MQKRVFRSITFLLIINVILISSFDVLAQRKKRKKSKDVKTEIPVVASQEDKRKAEMYHIEAEKYFILDDYAKAFVLYQNSLKSDPANGTAYYRMAQIYQKGNDNEKAVFNAQRAIKLDDTNKYFYLLLADIYTKQSNFVDAAVTYEHMIQKCNKADEYLFELAAIYI